MKKKIIGGIIAAVLVAAVVGGVIWHRSRAQVNEELVIKAGSGEEIVYATIDRITGNDMDVTVMDEETAEQMIALSEAAKTTQSEGSQSFGDRGGFGNMEMPDMGGGMPGGEMFGGGGMPDMAGGMPDEMPGEEAPEDSPNGMPGGEAPEGAPTGRTGGEVPEAAQEEKSSYRIPVGTDVITSLGAVTTFSHLEEGDTIAILKQKDSDIILKIWMIM